MPDESDYARLPLPTPALALAINKGASNLMTSARSLAARSWFGYGRWEAPYWFIGMEPGGADDEASYEAWQDLGGGELIDCRAHHLSSNDPIWTRWHAAERPPTQPTWRRLIQLFLSFEGTPTDLEAVARFQRDDWGSEDGETALIEVSGLHSPSLGTSIERTVFRDERIAIILNRMREYAPRFAVMYGLGYREIYEGICESSFDEDGFTWSGPTLCVLVEHPAARPGKSAEWWMRKGLEIRSRLLNAELRNGVDQV